jgi:hypothetical protein
MEVIFWYCSSKVEVSLGFICLFWILLWMIITILDQGFCGYAGLCTNEKCPYRHVNVNPKAPVCEGFLQGYCADGDMVSHLLDT